MLSAVLPKQGICLLLGEEMGNMPLWTAQHHSRLCCLSLLEWLRNLCFVPVARLFIEEEIIGGVFQLCSGSVFKC